MITVKEVENKYPHLFEKCQPEILDGWAGIIECLCEKIGGSGDKFTCIKEKFGTLRVYIDDYVLMSGTPSDPYATWKAIDVAEAASSKTCEKCGTTTNVTTEPIYGRYWIKTFCRECRGQIYNKNKLNTEDQTCL